MTEDEAKTKWCPAFRVSHAGAGGHQYSTTDFSTTDNRHWKSKPQCLGSACMAWRWEDGTIHTTDGKAWNLMPSIPAEGYCGLAGKP